MLIDLSADVVHSYCVLRNDCCANDVIISYSSFSFPALPVAVPGPRAQIQRVSVIPPFDDLFAGLRMLSNPRYSVRSFKTGAYESNR